MASTYSALKVELIGTGEQTGTWGTTTNTNFSTALGEAITGSADVAFSSADVTITLTDTNNAQTARNLRLNLTGTSGGARQLILGSGCQIEKLYLINNGLADAVTVKNTSGTGIEVPPGKSMFVFNNGTNVVDGITYAPRVVVIADGTSVTINGDTTDIATQANTQAVGTLTINAPTGTPANGQRIMFRLTSTNVQTFSWNAAFAGATDLVLPAVSSGGGLTDYVGFIYNSTAAKWQLVAKVFGF
jgi:hypothetical protein